MPETTEGQIDSSKLDFTATVIGNVGIMTISLGPFGFGLFHGVSDMPSKIVLFVATAMGVMALLLSDTTRKHVLVLGLMAVMASVVFGDRDSA